MTQATENAGIKSFLKGTVMAKEGTSSPDEMFIILQGSAGVYKNYGLSTETQLSVLSQGSAYGELSFFLNREREETLVALTTVAALVITRQNLQGFFAGQPKLAISMVEGLCQKLTDPEPEQPAVSPASGPPLLKTPLFPENHGNYMLPLTNDSPALFPDSLVCPLCGQRFLHLSVLESKLGRAATDPDLRVRYASVDPMYYEIVTCPGCLLSAPSNKFAEVERRHRNEVNKAVAPYKTDVSVLTGKERDTFTVFAGYYLAMLSAPVIFYDHQLVTSNLMLKIARLYQDCGDNELYLSSSRKALELYLYVYQNLRISDKQSQQVAFLLGDLYSRLGDTDNAGKFFFDIKTDKSCPPLLARQADLRLDEIREIRAAERAAAEPAAGAGKKKK